MNNKGALITTNRKLKVINKVFGMLAASEQNKVLKI